MPDVVGGIGGIVGGILGAKERGKKLKKGQQVQQAYLDRIIKEFEAQKPQQEAYNQIGLSTLEELAGQPMQRQVDSRLADIFRSVNRDLASTGNLRSGLAQDLKLRAAGNVYDQVFNERLNVAQIGANQALGRLASQNTLLGLGANINSNIANTIFAKGANNAQEVESIVGGATGILGGLSSLGSTGGYTPGTSFGTSGGVLR